MVSFEQAFGDTEREAGSIRESARQLGLQAKALETAARTGDISAIRRAQSRLDESLSTLRNQTSNASSIWPFKRDEEEQYLSDRYADELRRAAEETGLDIFERDGQLISHPSIVRILPRDRVVRVDSKRIRAIRPSHLAGLLLLNQQKSSRHRPGSFLEALYAVYSDVVSEDSSGRLLKGNGRVVRLARIYSLLTSLPGSRREYDRSDFARDLYIIDSEGPKLTRTGAIVSFPASTGTRTARDLFTFVAPDGRDVQYYGIQFTRQADA